MLEESPSFSRKSLGLNGGEFRKQINRLSFKHKFEFNALKELDTERERHLIKKEKLIDYSNVWNIKPVDFSLKIYHPKAPKRNSREAIKPWIYDKYLRKSESSDNLNLKQTTKSADARMIASFLENNENKIDDKENFETQFRPITPNEDRFQHAKEHGFRAHYGQYVNPKPHDFRGVFF
jgi:hypothetical protein